MEKCDDKDNHGVARMSNKKLIEKSKDDPKLAFHGEVNSLEFTKKIGNTGDNPNNAERDMELANIGIKLFRRHLAKKGKKKGKNCLTLIRKTAILSSDEIDILLTGTEKEQRKISKSKRTVP